MPGPQPIDCIPLPVRIVGRGLDPSAAARGLAALQFPASICHPAGRRGRRPLQPYANIQYYIKGLPNENCHYLPRLPEKSGGCRCFLPCPHQGRPHHCGRPGRGRYHHHQHLRLYRVCQDGGHREHPHGLPVQAGKPRPQGHCHRLSGRALQAADHSGNSRGGRRGRHRLQRRTARHRPPRLCVRCRPDRELRPQERYAAGRRPRYLDPAPLCVLKNCRGLQQRLLLLRYPADSRCAAQP